MLALALVLAVGLPLAPAAAFTLRGTTDGSRPVGEMIDRSRQPGFVDADEQAERRAERRRLRVLAEEIIRAWLTHGWREAPPAAPPQPQSTAVPAAQRTLAAALPQVAAPPKIIRLDDRPRPDTRVIRGAEGNLKPYVLHLRNDNG